MKYLFIINFTFFSVALAAQIVVNTTTINPTCFSSKNGTIFTSITGGAPPFTYAWSNGKTTRDINLLGAGTYTVSVTDSKGYTAQASATLASPPEITIDYSVFENENGTFTVTITAAGGVGNFIYSMNGSKNWQSNGVFIVPAGTYIFKVLDGNICQKSILKKI